MVPASSYVLTALAVVALLPALRRRLQLSRAKHPSLRGHAKWSRRMARLVRFFEYDGDAFFVSDAAPESVEVFTGFRLQQGSTIIVFATPDYRLADGVTTGVRVAMGQALLVGSHERRNRTRSVRTREEEAMTFAEELRQQRWDDHRYYHHNHVNQSLHLLSALCFLTSYVLFFIHPAAAVFVGWLLAMVLRQTGHFFFEPQTYDEVNQATHAYKESVKVGYNLRRKVVLLSIWSAAPMALYVDPTFLGLFESSNGVTRFLDHLALLWWVIGLGAVILRTVHLFLLKGVQSGLVWCTKILTDPFHDIKIYHKAPYYMLKGEMYDDMSEWYDDAVRARVA